VHGLRAVRRALSRRLHHDEGAGRAWSVEDARAAGERHRARNRRLAARSTKSASAAPADTERAKRRAAVAAALARARARRGSVGDRVK
jgi:hypothetical protein